MRKPDTHYDVCWHIYLDDSNLPETVKWNIEDALTVGEQYSYVGDVQIVRVDYTLVKEILYKGIR